MACCAAVFWFWQVLLILFISRLASELFTGLQTCLYFSKFCWSRAESNSIRQRSHSRYADRHQGLGCICCHSGKHHLLQVYTTDSFKQARFALMSTQTFSQTDLATDLERFYNSVLKLLEDPDEKDEVDQLMGWWNWYMVNMYFLITKVTSLQTDLSVIYQK